MANEMQTSTMLPQAGQVFAQLLEPKKAPKGDLQTDFKTALYLCAATKHYTFEEVLSQRKLDILSFMLSSVGFKGSTSNIGIEQYLDTIQELLDDGAIEYIGEGAGFVASAFKKVSQGKVSCARSNIYAPPGMQGSELRFTDEEGNVYPLFSKYLTIPGDVVKVVINTFLGAAYVVSFVKMRASLMGDMPENSEQIFFREKGFNAYDIRVTKDHTITPGSLVVAEIISRKSPNILIVKAQELKGDRGVLDNFIVKAILEHDIASAWPDTVKRSIKNIPKTVNHDELKGRVDLRNLPLVTIDGEDARDFDDAVYCTIEDNKYHLYVAIADVSYYVRTGSAIDAEALERTTSVYFPYFVVPMLPEELSNGICSLNPNVDRLCMVCDMIISKAGKIESYDFYPAVMNSHARLTYTEVHTMITEGKAIYPEHEQCLPWIDNLYKVYQALSKASDNRGVFKFESTEVHFLFDEHWKVKGMEPDETTEANQLIEECMIAANVCAATFVKENGFQTLYRIHDVPSEEKLDRLRAILSLHGIDLPNGYEPTPQDFRKVSDQVSKLPEGVHQVIALQLLRSMSKAQYSPDNIGHFGLALQNYSHFTSPIRRYPDLQIHRVIKYILEKKQKRDWGKIGSQQYSHDALVKLGTACTKNEIQAANAEYDVDNSLKCEYLKNFINEVVDGTVSAITDRGIFITLNDFFIDGMIKDIYTVDHGNIKGFSIGSRKVYHEGDQIKVRIAAVKSEARLIDLLPVVNPRKKDVSFDIQEAKAYLKQQASSDLKASNEIKTKFLDSISHFTRGVAADNDNTATRAHLDYSIKSSLNIEDDMEAINEKPASSKKADSSVPNATKSSSKKAPAKKAAAKTATKATAKAETKADAKAEAKASSKSAKETKEPSKAVVSEDVSGGTVITVKRKSSSKGTKKTTVIALENDAKSKAKKEEIDPLLIDTASRIDADLGSDNKIKSTKSAKSDKTSAPKVTKSGSKGSKSNAKSKQVLDDEEVTPVDSGSLTDNLTLAKEVKLAKPQTKTAKSKAKSAPQVDEVKDQADPKVAAKPAAKSTSKAKASAKAKEVDTKASTKVKAESPVEVKEAAAKTSAKKASTKAPAKAAPKSKAKAKAEVEPAVESKVEPKAEPAKAPAKSTAKKASPAKAATKASPAKAATAASAKAAPAKATATKSAAKTAAKSAATAEAKSKVEEVKEEVAKAPAKAAAKKTTKAPAKAAAKKEPAVAETPAVAEPAAKAKAPAKATATKSASSAKTSAKAEVKEEAKAPAKAPAKAAAKKATTAKKEPAKSEVTEVKATKAKAEPKVATKAKAEPKAKAPAKSTAKAATKSVAKKATTTASKAAEAKAPAKAPAKKAAAKKAPAKSKAKDEA
ncbi:VacB/RNase II family 3'-5' exoribonuclease [Anaerobiospirillum sp. NML120448]|uniref:ribonuclease R family protein n=1 Tax=Anaerobiospirillum sp. NML120448 TaxID=2932816 RepID=UPI001FF3FBBF|nr:VacB/RNase II family 3'-5' exoribonuclease [Anaerobiospirillum sp. NML120448]MCK0514275.1 VacB/RNase II family 3'-5' exoribonuclease [Anaerobiospirillum sp. NML120448]